MSMLAGNNDKEDFALTSGHIPLLLMPNRYKSFREMSFGDLSSVWRQTYEALETADAIVAVGYSFRDLHFNQLLYEALQAKGTSTPVTAVTKSEKDAAAIEEATDWINMGLTPVTGGLEGFVETLS
jgi:thiamine pyrophosphate-dependent acetolactate synthase large subunit-like protein